MKRENVMFKKRYLFIALFVALIVGISFGYAQLQTTLTINGTTTISKVTWGVEFENVQVTSGSFLNPDANNSNAAQNVVTLSNNNTTLTYDVSLLEPGQYFEFSVDVHNKGTIDAKLQSLTRGNDDTPFEGRITDYFNYTETGLKAVDSVLKANDTNSNDDMYTLTFKVEYKSDVTASQLPGTGDPTSFKRTITMNYVQAN